MTTISHSFDGLADGTTITTSTYGAGTAPGAVVGTVVSDAARAVHGDMAARFSTAANTTAGIQDTTSLGTQTVVRGRAYIYIPANPSANLRLFQTLDGTTLACSVGLSTAGRVRLVDSAFVQMVASSISVPLNQTIRIEWRFVASTTAGQASARVWFSPESTGTPDIDISSAASFNTRGSFSRYDSGLSFSGSQTYTAYGDEIVWTDDDAGEVGPYVAPSSDQTFEFDFEDGTTGGWSIATNVSVHGDYARSGAFGARVDARTSFSRLRLDTSAFGSGHRWSSVRFRTRFPQGAPTEDVALVRWRNTDPSSAGGGGNGDVWLDSADQTLRGDLQPGDWFTHPTPLAAGAWYGFHGVCGFLADGTSVMRIKLNGTEVADVTSTINDPGQTLQWIEFGTLSTQDDVFDVDDVTIVVGDSDPGYLDDFPQSGVLEATTPAVTGALSGTVRVAGALAGTTPAAQGSVIGSVRVAGTVAGQTPAAVGALTGSARVAGELAGTAPAAEGSFTGVVRVAGQLAGTAPAVTGALAGGVRVSGALAGQAPAAEGALLGTVRVAGSLAGTTPAPTGSLSGVVAVRGALAGQSPAAEGAMQGRVAVSGVLAGTTPAVQGALAGTVHGAGGTLHATTPAATGALTGRVRVSGQLAATAPAVQGALLGAAAVRGDLAGTAPAVEGALVGTVTAPGGVLAGTTPAAVGELAGRVRVAGVLAAAVPAVVGSLTGTSGAVAAAPARLSSGSSAAVDLSSSVEQLVTLKGGTA